MIVGSFALVLTVVAVSIGVICRIQFRSMPTSTSPPCVIQRVNNGSQSSHGHGKRGSRGDDDGGRDKRVVLLSINGGKINNIKQLFGNRVYCLQNNRFLM